MLLHPATVTMLSGLALKLIRKDTPSCKQLDGTIIKWKHQHATEKTENNYFISVKSRGESLIFAKYSQRSWKSLSHLSLAQPQLLRNSCWLDTLGTCNPLQHFTMLKTLQCLVIYNPTNMFKSDLWIALQPHNTKILFNGEKLNYLNAVVRFRVSWF